ncbi:MAG: glycine zipper domain-containing protein [Planctomycetota bacterium]
MPARRMPLCRLVVGVIAAAVSADSAAQYAPPVGPTQSAPAYGYAPTRGYYRNDTAEGTIKGGALGAIAGALIGGSEGKSPEGALIGAGVGAITGNLFGRSRDAADRQEAAYGYAQAQRANAQAAALAVTNYDLVQMTAAGLDEGVIIGAIQSRGAQLDLSPSGLIALKQGGVSDNVIRSAQRAVIGPAVAPAPVVAQPQTVIIDRGPVWHYRPAYRVHYGFGVCR